MKTRIIAFGAVLAVLTACGASDEAPEGEKVVYQAPGGKAVTYNDLIQQIKQTGGLSSGADAGLGDGTCEEWLDGSLRYSTLEFPNGEDFFLKACYAGLKALRKGK